MYINITVSTYNNNGTQYTITHPINQYQIAYKGYWHIFMYYMYMLHPLLNSSFFFHFFIQYFNGSIISSISIFTLMTFVLQNALLLLKRKILYKL